MDYIARVLITKQDAEILLPEYGFVNIGQGQWVTQQEEPCSTAEALNNILSVMVSGELEKITKKQTP